MWEEDGKPMIQAVPSHWVDESQGIVFWPPKGGSCGNAVAKSLPPTDDWQQFTLLKMKLRDSSRDMCKSYIDFETTTEAGSEEENTPKKKGCE